ncbi:hypothetical protein IJT10_05100 [bacterium]|nr:hypothetical protein [bacterium]
MKLNTVHRIFAVILLFCLFSASICYAEDQIATYRNERFKFKANIPRWLKIKEPRPANGDGLTFVSDKRKLEVKIYGVNNVLNRTAFQEASSDADVEEFKVLYDYPKKAAINWQQNKKICWKKAVLIQDSPNDMGHFIIVYATSDVETAFYNEETVTNILKSLAPI